MVCAFKEYVPTLKMKHSVILNVIFFILVVVYIINLNYHKTTRNFNNPTGVGDSKTGVFLITSRNEKPKSLMITEFYLTITFLVITWPSFDSNDKK